VNTQDNADKGSVSKPQPKTMKGCFLGFLVGPIITEIGLVGWTMYEESQQ
jgi:hypothetical protein